MTRLPAKDTCMVMNRAYTLFRLDSRHRETHIEVDLPSWIRFDDPPFVLDVRSGRYHPILGACSLPVVVRIQAAATAVVPNTELPELSVFEALVPCCLCAATDRITGVQDARKFRRVMDNTQLDFPEPFDGRIVIDSFGNRLRDCDYDMLFRKYSTGDVEMFSQHPSNVLSRGFPLFGLPHPRQTGKTDITLIFKDYLERLNAGVASSPIEE